MRAQISASLGGTTAPGDEEREASREILELVGRSVVLQPSSPSRLVHGDTEVTLPEGMVEVLHQVAAAFARGDGVAVIPVSPELSTADAARMLQLSRPAMIALLDAGEIRSRQEGAHRRVALRDVVAYREKRIADQTAAYLELMRFSDEQGLIEG